MTDAAPAPPLDSSPKSRRAPIIALGLLISALFAYLAFRKIDLEVLGAEILRANLRILLLAVAAKIVALVLSSVRSHLLLAPLGRFRLVAIFRSVLIAFAANNLFPFRTGDLIRIDYLAREGAAMRSSCMAVVLLERLLDSFVLLALFASTLPAAAIPASFAKPVAYLAITFSAAMGGAVWISHRPDVFVRITRVVSSIFGAPASTVVGRHADTFARGLAGLHAPHRIAGAVAATVGFWLLNLVSIRIWFAAFDLSLPWYAPVLVLAFLSFGMTLPASPANLGTYHYFVILALTALGVEDVVARSVAVVGHAVAIVPLTVIGLPLLVRYLLERSRRRAGESLRDLPAR